MKKSIKKITKQFFEYAIEDTTSCVQNAKDFIDFIDRAHGSIYGGTNVCPTHNIFLSLKNFFADEDNSWEEKEQFFIELCKENKKNQNIFMNMYHLKKYGFDVICS